MITQKLDSTDPILGFTVSWMQELAARVEHLHVLSLTQSAEILPPNVTAWSMGKDRGYSRLREVREFYRVLGRVIRNVDIIFCHMIPRYAWLCAPYAMAYRKPIVMWYTHRQIDLELRLAVRVCKYVLTAAPDSFPLRTNKLHVMGHGIDNGYYTPAERDSAVYRQRESGKVEESGLPLIIQVARLMPIKHQETLLRALGTGIAARVSLVGAVPEGQDTGYLTRLQALTRELGIADRVTFTGGLPISATRDLYRQAAIAVNLSPPGLFDKAVLESMMVGVPTIVANPAFDNLLGGYTAQLRISGPDDVPGLAERLRALLILSSDQRYTMGNEIRERAIAEHGIGGLMDRVLQLMAK